MISTPKQRQIIGYLRKTLKFDDETYKDIISFYGVNSSTQLTYSDANDLIDRLKSQAVTLGLYVPHTGKNYSKYENLAGRRGMATPKQLRYINIKWKNVSKKGSDAEKERALNRFMYRITGKERANFLTQEDVSKIIKAIDEMEKQGV